MKIKLKLGGMLRRYVPDAPGDSAYEIDLPAGSTVVDVARYLGIPTREIRIAYVDGQARGELFRLHDGAEVGFFPPIGGG